MDEIVILWHIRMYIVQFGAELKSLILIRLHLAQAFVATVRLCMSPFQYKRPYGIWEQYRQDQHAQSTCMYHNGLTWVYAYCQQNALSQQAVWILRCKTAEILFFTFKLRTLHLWGKGLLSFCTGSNKNKHAVPFWSIFGQLVYLCAVKRRGLLRKTVDEASLF